MSSVTSEVSEESETMQPIGCGIFYKLNKLKIMKGYLITLVIVVAGVLLAGYLKDKVFHK